MEYGLGGFFILETSMLRNWSLLYIIVFFIHYVIYQLQLQIESTFN